MPPLESRFTKTFFKPRQASPLVWYLAGLGCLVLFGFGVVVLNHQMHRVWPSKTQLVSVTGIVESVVERHRDRRGGLTAIAFRLLKEPILFRYGQPNACRIRAVLEELQQPGALAKIYFERDLEDRSSATVLALSVNGRTYLSYERSLANYERNWRLGLYGLPVIFIVTAYSFLAGWFEYRRRLSFI